MATGSLAPVIRYLRQVTNPAASGELADVELLSRFARHRDEAAFTTLVRRHGPMVLAVCRRVVRDGHAAEDAFQATFLVLARKAGALTQPELLGNWLYGVAYRTAMRARRETTKRRFQETQAVHVQEASPSDEPEWRDLRAVLDEEVNRLPERYCLPVVLCYLQGQTNAEAARRLGCSRGTVATLLARARDKLRRRLTQRGIGLSVGVALGALTPTGRGGTVPLALENVTVKAATLLSAGHTQAVGALADRAVALAKGVSKGMLMEKLKIPVAILMMTVLVGTGAGVSVYCASAPDSEVAEPATDAKPRTQNRTEGQRKHASTPVGLPEPTKAIFRTTNFVVTAPTAEIARQVGEAAERNRKELAQLWLGEELDDWGVPCPVRVTVTEKTTGSAAVFAFDEGVVSRDGMVLEGPLDRIFADLLPHEMTHTILAEWRGRPVPRWADEGAAMLSESASSRARQERAMERLLRTGRTLPLTELLPRRDYPKDVMTFYTQSFSLTNFLVTAGGREKFLQFVATGMDNDWNKAARFVYGYNSVEALEQEWLRVAQKRLADKRSDEPSRPRQEASAEYQLPPLQGKALVKHSFQEKLPLGPPPIQILAVLAEDGRLTFCQKVSAYQSVTEYATLKNGRKVPVTSYVETSHDIVAAYDIDKVRVCNAKGSKIDAKDLRQRFKKETVALISADGRPVDPLHLRMYKEDTLVLVIDFPATPALPPTAGTLPAFPRERMPFVVPPPPVAVPGSPQVIPPLAVPAPPRVDDPVENIPPSGL